MRNPLENQEANPFKFSPTKLSILVIESGISWVQQFEISNARVFDLNNSG